MPKNPYRIVRTGPDVETVHDRMIEIVGLIQPTQSSRAEVEYSALLAAAVTIVAATAGIESTPQTLSMIFGQVIYEIVPAIEDLVKELVK